MTLQEIQQKFSTKKDALEAIQMVIDSLPSWIYIKDSGIAKYWKDLRDEVEQLPDWGGWVDVKEKLPEQNGYYICWVISDSVPNGEQGLIHYHKNTGWQNGFYNVTHYQIIIKPINKTP